MVMEQQPATNGSDADQGSTREELFEQLSMMDTGGTIMFFQHVQACQISCNAKTILDFGAGRGAALVRAQEAGHRYIAFLHDLRSLGAHVTACDIDDAVKTHPASDDIVVMDGNDKLPFADAAFDLVMSDFTFEHIEKPGEIAAELLRVLKPGGIICARTPNKYSYVALVASLVPDAIYSRLLRWAQPNRRDDDKFPIVYGLNDEKSLQRHFAPASVHVRFPDFEPSYFFGSKLLKGMFKLLHKFLPRKLRTGIIITVRKPLTSEAG